MTDLKLVADPPTALERLLLNAAVSESPSAEQRLRVRKALGLSTVMVAAPVAVAARNTSLFKAAMGGGLMSGAAVALVLLASRPFATPTQKPSPQVPVAASMVPALGTVTSAEAARAVPTVEPSGVNPVNLAPSLVAPAQARPKRAVVEARSADLSEQLRLIESARAAVADRDAAGASRSLASYAAKFPRGSFGQEAAVLRIEALDLQGNHAQAQKLAHAFLAAHPNSPHVGLVRRVASE